MTSPVLESRKLQHLKCLVLDYDLQERGRCHRCIIKIEDSEAVQLSYDFFRRLHTNLGAPAGTRVMVREM